MKITVLGTASGVAVNHRFPSAYLIHVDEQTVLVDAGDGIVRQFIKYNLDPNKIKSIFISHTHPDHAAGLIGLLQQMHLTGRKKTLKIFLPEGLLPGFNKVFPFFQIFRKKWPFQFQLFPISGGSVFQEGTLSLIAYSNGHLAGNLEIAASYNVGCDSYSFLLSVDGTKNILYTSDIDGLSHLKTISQDVEILLSECTHVNPIDVLNFAQSAGIPRVIFTHIHPDLENAITTGAFNHLNIVPYFASDGDIIEV